MGSNTIQFFQVYGPGAAKWTLYPKGNGLTLNQLSMVKYGEVPATCDQAEPKNGPAPPLVEGGVYDAFAAIFDDAPVSVRFIVKDGTAIEQPQK